MLWLIIVGNTVYVIFFDMIIRTFYLKVYRMFKPVLLKHITTTEIKRFPRATKRGKGQQLPLFCCQEGFRKANIEVFTNNRLIM